MKCVSKKLVCNKANKSYLGKIQGPSQVGVDLLHGSAIKDSVGLGAIVEADHRDPDGSAVEELRLPEVGFRESSTPEAGFPGINTGS